MARRGWSRSLSGFARQVEQELTQQQRTIAAEALQMLIRGSPVDSGSYRGNHRVSIGSPDQGVDPNAGSPTPPRGQLEMDTFNREAAKIAALNVPFTVVYIQNNIAHGDVIENGSSQQAPAGVYAVTANSLREKYGR